MDNGMRKWRGIMQVNGVFMWEDKPISEAVVSEKVLKKRGLI
jgi:hypothetical protein